MREIKFRAYDKENKEITEEFQLLRDGKTDCLCAYKPTPEYGELTNEYVLMQYTGLKDKRNVEIFEGDIVRWFGTMTLEQHNEVMENEEDRLIDLEASIGIVDWDIENAGFGIQVKKTGFMEYGDKERYSLDFYGYEGREFNWEELEVTGNIYEDKL